MAESPALNIMTTVFPVVALSNEKDGELARPDSFGTAFCLSPGVFLTAAHVVDAALECGRLALAGPAGEGMPMGAARVHDHQVWHDVDVAVMYADVNVTVLSNWLVNRVQVLMDLCSFGYPHAFTAPLPGEEQRITVAFRAYKGHVITHRVFDRLNAKPAIYEVASPYPAGLSGAPAILFHDGTYAVAGMVLGQTTVYYHGSEQTVGTALAASEILKLVSTKAGVTLGALPGVQPVGLGFQRPTVPSGE